jgi:DNA repair photolyase
VFVVQTRGPLILRDIERLRRLAQRCVVRVSFSLTTDREEIRKLYEPHCEPLEERLQAIRELVAAGIETYATLAPLLPCDPETLARAAMKATHRDLIGDPLHVRATKRTGATTRAAAWAISRHHGFEQWLDAAFQTEIIERIRQIAAMHGRRFATGPEGFSWLAQK